MLARLVLTEAHSLYSHCTGHSLSHSRFERTVRVVNLLYEVCSVRACASRTCPERATHAHWPSGPRAHLRRLPPPPAATAFCESSEL
ncbi:unnamed protein product [Danaus chrysippus]|uniref:(African queen) hypothetical protein n=1 Tax=Danaus chrysippus TaxID=151541 RepID=A0A8J2QLU1_9NEOP|nr:unnamed protein product [Danaus chrysippus]